MLHVAAVAMAMILLINSLSSRYINIKTLPNLSYRNGKGKGKGKGQHLL